MRSILLTLLTLVLTLAPGAFAQENMDREHGEPRHAEGVDREDANAAAAVVHQLFDAMRTKDTTAMRSLFHSTARLQRTGRNREGTLMVGDTPVDQFIQAIGGADGYLDEQIWDVEVRIDGDLATVWNKYAFFFNEQFSHCGIDAFQLARLEDGWKIIQISDTQRRGADNCWMPPDHEEHGS
jgi:hypothetical protein